MSELIKELCKKELWISDYTENTKEFTHYDDAKDFELKIKKIKKSKFSSKPVDNFIVQNFLTIALVRNFTNHYLNESLSLLSNAKEYDDVFAKEIFAIMYSLAHEIM